MKRWYQENEYETQKCEAPQQDDYGMDKLHHKEKWKYQANWQRQQEWEHQVKNRYHGDLNCESAHHRTSQEVEMKEYAEVSRGQLDIPDYKQNKGDSKAHCWYQQMEHDEQNHSYQQQGDDQKGEWHYCEKRRHPTKTWEYQQYDDCENRRGFAKWDAQVCDESQRGENDDAVGVGNEKYDQEIGYYEKIT